MKYRYLDLRRQCVRKNLELRHKMVMEIRKFLDDLNFMEVETPILINSTPEGARDFVVPSRMNPGQFYALPQSPQILKQLLMVSGFDRYFQIAKCFRDEDLRADRQPEFTQIDCEMSFVEQEDILQIFEAMAKHLFKSILGIEMKDPFQRMTWHDAMKLYGSDKPDLRFDMHFVELMDVLKGHGFGVFDSAEYIGGICAKGAATYTRKQIDALTEYVKRPQIGAKGMVYARVEADGSVKSSVDKFYTQEVLQQLKAAMNAEAGDLMADGEVGNILKRAAYGHTQTDRQRSLRNGYVVVAAQSCIDVVTAAYDSLVTVHLDAGGIEVNLLVRYLQLHIQAVYDRTCILAHKELALDAVEHLIVKYHKIGTLNHGVTYE